MASQAMEPGCSVEGAALYCILAELGIHTETFPYQQRQQRNGETKGIFCRNLFLKDRKSQFYLVICSEFMEKVDLKSLKQKLGAFRNFSFASADELNQVLGSRPGEVSPFALLNNRNENIQVAIEKSLTEPTCLLNFHPLNSTLTTVIAFRDLLKFVNRCGYQLTFVDLLS